MKPILVLYFHITHIASKIHAIHHIPRKPNTQCATQFILPKISFIPLMLKLRLSPIPTDLPLTRNRLCPLPHTTNVQRYRS